MHKVAICVDVVISIEQVLPHADEEDLSFGKTPAEGPGEQSHAVRLEGIEHRHLQIPRNVSLLLIFRPRRDRHLDVGGKWVSGTTIWRGVAGTPERYYYTLMVVSTTASNPASLKSLSCSGAIFMTLPNFTAASEKRSMY